MLFKMRVLLLFIGILPIWLFAGTTGKIKGRVVARSSGEALPGVRVSVEETRLSAITDLNGEFVILGVPSGEHTLKSSIVGYQSVFMTNVRVSIDLTTEAHFVMAGETEESSPVEIVAERPLITKNATHEIHTILGMEIEPLATRGYVEVAALNAGVIQRYGALHIRGGSADEVAYYVDGIPQNSPYDFSLTGELISNSIAEVQVQNGGFNAEYGFAGSGVIHATTKTGGARYAVSGELISDEFLREKDENLGAFSYGYNLYNLAVSGPVPYVNQARFYLAGERQFLRDQSPSSGVHPVLAEGLPRTVSGALPGNSLARWNWNGNMIFDFQPFRFKIGGSSTRDEARDYLHAFSLFNAARIPKHEEQTDAYYFRATQAVGAKTFYAVGAGYFRHAFEFGDHVWFDDLEAYGDKNKNPQLRAPGLNPVAANVTETLFIKKGTVLDFYQRNKSASLNLKADLTHQAGAHEFQAGLEYRYHTLRSYAIAPMELAAIRFNNPNLSDDQFYQFADAANIGYDLSGKNELDSGIDAARHPVLAAVYLQDKLELKSLVLNAGLRWDYFDGAMQQFKDPAQINFTATGQIDPKQLVEGRTYSNLSPRFSVSLPVSNQTVLHAHYGRFTQPPPFYQLLISYNEFARALLAGNFIIIGNPMQAPAQTRAFEIGLRQQIGDAVGLSLIAFYKETRDLAQIRTINALPVLYATFMNEGQSTVKGLTATLTLRRTHLVAATAAYTLQFAAGIADLADLILFSGNSIYLSTPDPPLNFDQRHTLTLNVDLRNAEAQGLRVFGARPLSRVGLNLLFKMGSGFPYTPAHSKSVALPAPVTTPFPRQEINSATMPATYTLDAKLGKSFTLAGVELNVYLWALNVLATKNVVNVYPQSGKPDDDGYLNTPDGRNFLRNHEQIIGTADFYKARVNDPFNFGAPRQYRLGLRFDLR